MTGGMESRAMVNPWQIRLQDYVVSVRYNIYSEMQARCAKTFLMCPPGLLRDLQKFPVFRSGVYDYLVLFFV